MPGSDFITRKQLGTAAEVALRDLVTLAGGIAAANQINHDTTRMTAGAAVAHIAAGRTMHLPDLTVLWPRHPIRRFGLEAKAKSPLARGGWGWDISAFGRALRWSEMTNDPVFYCIRDLSAAPLPLAGEMDNPDHWHIASVWKLMHSPSRTDDGKYLYWPGEDFTPLIVLLAGAADISTATVPCIHLGDGRPPIIL
jgi:hypothetical protein